MNHAQPVVVGEVGRGTICGSRLSEPLIYYLALGQGFLQSSNAFFCYLGVL
jgi:hypothetical protein